MIWGHLCLCALFFFFKKGIERKLRKKAKSEAQLDCYNSHPEGYRLANNRDTDYLKQN